MKHSTAKIDEANKMTELSKYSGFISTDRLFSSVETDELQKILTKSYINRSVELKYNQMDPNINGVPLDYSFRKVHSLSELKHGTPREYRVGIPAKSSNGKFISSSLWVNYNNLSNLNDIKSLVQVSFNRPEIISWLDVSFNEIETLPEELLDLCNLKIFYLHGNQIKYFIEVNKLKPLKFLRTLTLHGNPIENNINYRTIVINTLPQLVNFDFSLVSK